MSEPFEYNSITTANFRIIKLEQELAALREAYKEIAKVVDPTMRISRVHAIRELMRRYAALLEVRDAE